MDQKSVIDPTLNVKEALQAAVNRLDDLRIAEAKRVDEKLELIFNYEEKLRVAEQKRIDAIRAVDVNAVSVANEKAIQQASILATQLTATAETLRNLAASDKAELSNRITQLEKIVTENKGTSGGMEKMWGWIFGIGMAAVSVWAMFFK